MMCCGLICPRTQANSEWFMRTSGDATRCAYPAVEKFCRASSAGGRRHLQTKFVQPDRVGRRGLSEPGGIFSRLTTNAFLWLDSVAVFVTDSVCVPSRWKVLSGEFRRRPTEFVIKLRNPDRVGRRGLSEPGGIFSRLITYAFPWLYQYLYPLLYPQLYGVPHDASKLARSDPSTIPFKSISAIEF